MSASPASLTADLKAHAAHLGFDRCGVAAAGRPETLDFLTDWLNRGYAGEMGYLPRREAAYAHPASVLPPVRSVVMCAVNYKTAEPADPAPGSGRVARYAWGGVDYHDLLKDRLQELAAWLHGRVPGCRTRAVVDTAPLLERDFARRAGLGWFGKNTVLIDKHLGSYLLLCGLLTDAVLEYDEPHHAAHCGTCTACLDACPTDAFVAPHVLDARRCISYLTIELRGTIPEPLREGIGEWLFGCDVCQEVCPWNRKAPTTADPAFHPRPDLDPADCSAILSESEEEWRSRFRGTPLDRPKRAGLRRNAAIVLGNSGDRRFLPILREVAADVHEDPAVRNAAAWAAGRLSRIPPASPVEPSPLP